MAVTLWFMIRNIYLAFVQFLAQSSSSPWNFLRGQERCLLLCWWGDCWMAPKDAGWLPGKLGPVIRWLELSVSFNHHLLGGAGTGVWVQSSVAKISTMRMPWSLHKPPQKEVQEFPGCWTSGDDSGRVETQRTLGSGHFLCTLLSVGPTWLLLNYILS